MEMTTERIWELYLANLVPLRQAAKLIYYQLLVGKSIANVYSTEDILHEGLLRIQRNPSQLRYNLDKPDRALINLMYTAMRSFCFNILSRERKQDIGQEGLQTELDKLSARNTPLEEAEQEYIQEREAILDISLEELAVRRPRTAIVLAYGLDIDPSVDTENGRHNRMAAQLGISSLSYRQLRHQGIKQLRKTLNP